MKEPPRAISTPAADRDPGQHLEHDPVGEDGGDVRAVVGRRHLHDVDADDRQPIAIRRTASSSWRPVRPPGSGVPVPGAMPGSTTSTSTDTNTPSQSSTATRLGLVEAGVETALDHLVHLERAHALLGHPGQGRRLGPVAPQADLQEPVAAAAPLSISRRIGVPWP